MLLRTDGGARDLDTSSRDAGDAARRCREVAHDLNNWLCCIEMLASSQVQTGVSPDVRATLGRIRDAATQAGDLCRELSSYPTSETCSGSEPTQSLSPIELHRMFFELNPLLSALVPSAVDLQWDLEPDLPAVNADAAQLKSVVINLVKNATEALSNGPGRITVRAGRSSADDRNASCEETDRCGNDFVLLEVSDDGCGIDETTLERIFEPNFSSKGEGHGLGMASVRDIVARHGGSIEIESESGGGTSVRVFLPCETMRADEAASVAVEENCEAAGAEDVHDPDSSESDEQILPRPDQGNILVVDDQRTFRMLAECLLEPYGFAVSSTESAEDALLALRGGDHGFTAVLLDLRLEGMGGVEGCRQIRLASPELPVILTTGCSQAEIEAAFAGHEAPDAILEKPFNLELLLRTLRTVHQKFATN